MREKIESRENGERKKNRYKKMISRPRSICDQLLTVVALARLVLLLHDRIRQKLEIEREQHPEFHGVTA